MKGNKGHPKHFTLIIGREIGTLKTEIKYIITVKG